MRTMQTRVVLSHIVYGAKPCFGAIENTEEEDEKKPSAKKRRKR